MRKQNVRLPLRQCYQMGVSAYDIGVSQNKNPYDPRTDMLRHRWWREGWLEAQSAGLRRRTIQRYNPDEKED
jgi:hypothetical protein